jgi:hypothetical protein
MGTHTELAEILNQMGSITRMRRGKLTEQYNRKRDEDGNERLWGPYYTLQAWVEGKNRSERVSREHAEEVREDIERYEKFTGLCDRYVQVAEKVAKAEVADSKKKPKRSRRQSVGKSRSS